MPQKLNLGSRAGKPGGFFGSNIWLTSVTASYTIRVRKASALLTAPLKFILTNDTLTALLIISIIEPDELLSLQSL
ncbi:MAG: hypothetical protein NE334_05530 [Lentisphaeraceae bacterium]|nr:hypothetical protein [Lentisphaeraceae bacterium]